MRASNQNNCLVLSIVCRALSTKIQSRNGIFIARLSNSSSKCRACNRLRSCAVSLLVATAGPLAFYFPPANRRRKERSRGGCFIRRGPIIFRRLGFLCCAAVFLGERV